LGNYSVPDFNAWERENSVTQLKQSQLSTNTELLKLIWLF